MDITVTTTFILICDCLILVTDRVFFMALILRVCYAIVMAETSTTTMLLALKQFQNQSLKYCNCKKNQLQKESLKPTLTIHEK